MSKARTSRSNIAGPRTIPTGCPCWRPISFAAASMRSPPIRRRRLRQVPRRRTTTSSPPRWPQPRRSVDTRAHNRADLTRDGFPAWPVLNRLLVGVHRGCSQASPWIDLFIGVRRVFHRGFVSLVSRLLVRLLAGLCGLLAVELGKRLRIRRLRQERCKDHGYGKFSDQIVHLAVAASSLRSGRLMCGWPPTCKSFFREEHWSLAVMCPAFRCDLT